MKGLFRAEAIAASGGHDLGRPISLVPPSWYILTAFLATVAVVTITFLATARFARRETVPGILRLSDGELRIVPPRLGIVRQIFVHDGEAVDAGTPLALISTEQFLSEGGALHTKLLAAIDREQATLEARMAALDQAFPLDLRALTDSLAGTRRQIGELNKQLPMRMERVSLAKEGADISDGLFKRGVMTGEQERQRRSDYLTQEQAVEDLRTEILRLETTATQTEASIAKAPADAAQNREAILHEIAALEEKRATAGAEEGFDLRAPVAGIVTGVQGRAGEPAAPNRPLMTILPHDSVLQAEMYVPSRAIGFAQPTDTVRIHYDAFPYERFGAGLGMVTQISATVFRPDEISAPISIKEPVYKITASLNSPSIKAYGHEIPLLSGMSLTADIILEDRTFLEFLLDPIFASRDSVQN